MKEGSEEKYRRARQTSLSLTIPLLLAVAPIVGLFLGRFLDNRLQTGPTFTLIFLGLGFVAGGREVYRILKRIAREEERAREQKSSGERDRSDT